MVLAGRWRMRRLGMTDAAPVQPIRPAATVVLWRDGARGPEVLMGQRGASAVFMPSKFVFPGGGIDAADQPRSGHLAETCAARLSADVPPGAPEPDRIVAAALRELVEETGLALAPGAALRFIFRAITPQGAPRRFDARFLLTPASAITGDPEDFSAAADELSALQWVPLSDARGFDLPFITEIVLSEVANLIAGGAQPGVPFFDNRGPRPMFRRLEG
jgi:8-oxo-dGTP pyrophosphatase MutT (NUDIX family)